MMSARDSLIDVALTQFAAQGYKETSVAALSRQAGTADGTLFHHFKSKDGLFLAVLVHVHDVIRRDVETALVESQADSGLEMVEELVTRLLALSEERPREFMLLFRNDAHRLACKNAGCRQLLESIYGFLAGAIEEGIVRGIDDGSVRAVSSPPSLAMLIISMLSGVVRFRGLDMWPTTRVYVDAIELCRRAIASGG